MEDLVPGCAKPRLISTVSTDFILIIFARVNLVERARIVTYLLSVAVVGLCSLSPLLSRGLRSLARRERVAYRSLTSHCAAELITCIMCQ